MLNGRLMLGKEAWDSAITNFGGLRRVDDVDEEVSLLDANHFEDLLITLDGAAGWPWLKKEKRGAIRNHFGYLSSEEVGLAAGAGAGASGAGGLIMTSHLNLNLID